MESTPPASQAPAASPTNSRAGAYGRSWTHYLVPFAPIVIAIGVAVIANRYYAAHPTTQPAMQMNGDAQAHGGLDVGDLAPDFTLADAHGQGNNGSPVTLSQLVEKGPVLLVYYLGYNCPRCVAHLARLDDAHEAYNSLGTQIIAVSPSTLTETRDSIENYGDFSFPMLCDDKLKVAEAYKLLYETPNGTTLFHGTYVIDRNRRVRFAIQTSHPYDDDNNLLSIIKSTEN